MRKNDNILWVLKGGLIVLFSFYMVGTTLFFHEHNIGNERIVHSHPFKDADHNHSTSEIFLIGQLSYFASTDDVVPQFNLETPVVLLDYLNSKTTNLFLSKLYFLTLSPRAPPVSAA